MSYDVAFRYSQALDPSALITIGTTLHAVHAAITDCRNAGMGIESDPAVILLVRHLSRICETRPTDAELRRDCMARIAELRNRPMLKTLALRGVAYDEPAKRLFHSEGRTAMRRLAEALDLEDGSFDICSNKAGAAVSGEITLHGEKRFGSSSRSGHSVPIARSASARSATDRIMSANATVGRRCAS